MKIVNILVENFRAIKKVELTDLNDMIVIAGPNGCGKSCVLDSIRLFKSVYGGYQPNEWQQWLGEFQIDFQRNPQQMASLLRDRSRSSVIQADIELSREEINFIKPRARGMLEELVWKTVVPGLNDPWLRARGALAGGTASSQTNSRCESKRIDAGCYSTSRRRQPAGTFGNKSDGRSENVHKYFVRVNFFVVLSEIHWRN